MRQAGKGDPRPYRVYYLGDFDRAGQDAARSLEEKLRRFTSEKNLTVVFEQIAVTEQQLGELNLPTREPKRGSAADRNWPYQFGCELDAIPPNYLRDLVESVVQRHLPQDQFETFKVAEESEWMTLKKFVSETVDMNDWMRAYSIPPEAP